MMGNPSSSFRVRSFRCEDRAACATLYQEGLVGGSLSENDTALDIDDIATVYMGSPGNHFWVVENTAGEVVGMIGVQHHDVGVGEIRRLRVRRDHRRQGIGHLLMETALKFCQQQHYLKITLDTFMEREAAIRLFENFQFKHHHTRKVNGKDLMYFYLDLYGGERKAAPTGF